ncbi:MAG TPA: hypothetical protein VFN46_08270 [Acetobacteraceae bacterium]|nr:hypothetical protein [Acetobacteraceae bacterium]
MRRFRKHPIAAGLLLATASAASLVLQAPARSAAAAEAGGQADCKIGPYAQTPAEYDYASRGGRLLEADNAADDHKARAVFERGLKDFPDSVWLKTGLAWTYLHEITFIRSTDPRSDIDHAYSLATEAAVANDALGNAAWRNHMALVPLFWLHDGDGAKAVAEAEIVHRQMPDDARIQSFIAGWMGAIGRTDTAIAWAEWAAKAQPDGPSWIKGNRGMVYYFAGRYQDALEDLKPAADLYPDMLSATYIRLGREDDARAAVTAWRKADPSATITKMLTMFPLAPDIKARYVADMTKAGLPQS